MFNTGRTTRIWLTGCTLAATLAFAAPTPASASSSPACRNAQRRLSRDQRRHAPQKVIERDQKLVRHYCRK